MNSDQSNDPFAPQGFAKEIARARAKELDRLARDGQAAARMSEAIEVDQDQAAQRPASDQVAELDAGSSQGQTPAQELSPEAAKQARARELAEQFKAKAARDRQSDGLER